MNTNPHQDALRSRWTLEGTIPLSGVADGAVWHRARSVATGDPVTLFIVRGETAMETADAVRRAYLVEDERLMPVRDVVVLDDPRESGGDAGSADGPGGPHPTTVVEYPLPPAPPLAALLGKGPMHPETARAVIGEAATGLEIARRRGLRHQFLDSNRIFVNTRSGEVKVLGVGVEAASHPGLDRSREVASFQDTAALTALLFRALTGRSPRPEADGTVPRPSTVVRDGSTRIPEDLDLLCELVLNGTAQGTPETTRGLIAALEPWQSIPVTLEAYRSRAEQAPQPTPTPAPVLGSPATGPDQDGPASTVRMEAVPPGAADDARRDAPGDAAPGAPDDDTSTRQQRTREPQETGEGAGLPDEDTIVSRARTPGSALPDEDTVARPAAASSPIQPSPSDRPSPDPRSSSDASSSQTPPAPDPSSASGVAASAAAAGMIGAAGAAQQSAAAPVTRPPESAQQDAAPPDAAQQDAARPGTEHSSADAQAIVRDLRLDQKRSSSAFPGHLDITLPRAPQTPTHEGAAPAARPSEQPQHDSYSYGYGGQDAAAATGGTAGVGGTSGIGGIAVAGGAVASAPGEAETIAGPLGPTAAAGMTGTSAPTGEGASAVPARRSGTRWPLAPAAGQPHGDQLAPQQAEQVQPAQPPPEPFPAGTAEGTPQHPPASAPTPASAVHQGPGAASPTPVTVAGRTEPITAGVETGPIVVRGRERSALDDEPVETTQPGPRSTLLREVVNVAVDSDDPDTFTMGPTQPEQRSRQSQWILLGGVLVVILALVFAVSSITSGLRERVENPLNTQPVTAPAATEEQPAPEEEPTEEEPAEEETLPAAELSGVELFVEGGDGDPDNLDQTDRITDGDPGTFWSTQHYTSPQYGGLKDGVGVRIDLAEQSTLSAVVVTTARNSGGTLELRAVAEDGSLGDTLATGEFAGDGEVRLELDEPVETEGAALWLSELPPDSNEDGRFRGRIAEIRVE